MRQKQYSVTFKEQTSAQTHSPQRYVVYLEDNMDVQEVFTEILQIGLPETQIKSFSRAIDAFEFMVAHSQEVVGVVSDIMLAGVDGIDFLDLIKRNDEFRELPFIFLSGGDHSVFKGLVANYRINHWLPKTCEAQTLIMAARESFLESRIYRWSA